MKKFVLVGLCLLLVTLISLLPKVQSQSVNLLVSDGPIWPPITMTCPSCPATDNG
jgi:hypothetical protein